MALDKRCSCGRLRVAAHHSAAHHQGTHRITYCRCECGQEWTEDVDTHRDPGSPVCAGEVIEVHEFLERWKGPLSDLLGK